MAEDRIDAVLWAHTQAVLRTEADRLDVLVTAALALQDFGHLADIMVIAAPGQPDTVASGWAAPGQPQWWAP